MRQVILSPYIQEWSISEEDNSITWNDIDSIVDYPSYQPEQGEEEVYVGLFTQSGENFDYQSTTLLSVIKNSVLSSIASFQGLSGNGVAYVKLQTHWEGEYSQFFEKGVACIVPFTWTKGSIAGQIARLQQAKADLKTSINAKGGTLIANETIDGYAAKVDLLPLPKEEQTKTVSSPNFSSGNVVVTPDASKVLTQVTVVKDNDLVPENIVKDVNIFGVVGTVETGGGVPLEQFISFDTDYSGSLYGDRLLTFFSRNPSGWGTPVDIKIYYKNGSNEDVLLISKRVTFDTVNFIVIPRSYGNLKIVMSLVPDDDYGWSGFSGFYAKTASPNVVTQLTAPSSEDDFVLSYIDFDVFHVVFTAYGD